MAEGFARQFFDAESWEIRSAGVEQHGLNPRAVKVMLEKGIDISTHTSDLIDMAYFNTSDVIITLCGDALDKCPVIPASITHQHWDLTDPARATGSEEEILDAFRQTRDTISDLVKELL
ncbi:arsenate reductase (thioredoxin) [Lactococcus insecticola]|uniref:Arsenate reductase (Thioredoxin) n=2 Tax=Pseudolactococcus insecticola TaxID=2709158 RepID=A0A6A0B6C2_9LACT|nr:arsenate reductase (thioredoxin) [Lactococcus insecticola]